MNVMPASTIRTYPDIGQKAFGHKGRLMLSVLLFMDLYLVAVEFLILGGDSLERLFPNTKQLTLGSLTLQGHKAFILITAFVVLPTTWLRSLGLLAYVSAGGILASVIVEGCVLWAGAFDGLGFHRQGVLFKLGGLLIVRFRSLAF
ncbi:Amino acid transporter, transmembrane domain containing protein [Parasponia andersonii]|uniref:Amino acid transporter, transmembrane domain containing protein n=1 Tax=Parasponia andersonii TaxID=3476 RepID=A0A2P5C7B8_PARAD|nr:Amino acid transporter, transmembrane domain containing protein [Parasponia andersonii]